MKRFLLILPVLLMLFTKCKITQPIAAAEEIQPVQPANDTIFIAAEVPEAPDTVSFTEPVVYREDTFSLVAVGDIMVGTNYPKNFLPEGDGAFLWEDSRSLFQQADIAFGNLEGTVLDGEGEPKECKNPDACYLFKMPTRLTDVFKECGFDLMSIANNHANDFGATGRKSTQKTLDSLGIYHAGSIERPYGVFEVGELKVGFIAFAPNRGTLTFYDPELAKDLVKKLSDSSDLVIVSIHGGAEGLESMHVTREREFYFGEDRGNIYTFSHEMVDAGADLIIGHGPHVPRAIEVYQDRLIAYSLGNFCTYGRFNLKGAAGVAPLLQVKFTREGKFLEGTIRSFRQSYAYGPLVDSSNEAARIIRELSEQDFPENPVTIDEEGRITYIQN